MNLEELLTTVSKDQRAILDQIWDYYVHNNSWIPAVALYRTSTKESVLSKLKPLGGSIVIYSRNAGERERFGLTFLGALLTTNGPALALMFLQYLGYIKKRLEADYELKSVDGAQVREGLQFDQRDNRLFMKALGMSPFLNGGSLGENTWTAGLPADVDDLFSGASIQEYFEKKALQNYDPAVPTEGDQRSAYLNSKARDVFPQSDFFPLANEDIAEHASGQTYDVFLSYASQETNEARAIYNSIVAAGGKAFLSEKHLKAGEDFAEAIRTALNGSTELWLLLSPNSLKSEWVISEWGAAWALKKRIVPILFQCAPTEAPDRIARLHCEDFHRYHELIEDRFPNETSGARSASQDEIEVALQISAMSESSFLNRVHRHSQLHWRVIAEIVVHATSVDDFVGRIEAKTGYTTLIGEMRGYLTKSPSILEQLNGVRSQLGLERLC